MCTLKSVNRCLPTCPRKQTVFFPSSAFPNIWKMETVQSKHTEKKHTEKKHRAQLYSKNDVSITLTATIMMTVRIYIVMGEWFILISSLYTLLKTSVLKNGDCICDM